MQLVDWRLVFQKSDNQSRSSKSNANSGEMDFDSVVDIFKHAT